MSDHNELITQFISATDAPESQAQFYLEMSQWNLEVTKEQEKKNAFLFILKWSFFPLY